MNRRLFISFLIVATLASCATSCNIHGTSNVSNLDGQMLYLKILKDNDMAKLDSCDVIHGQFSFMGNIDTVKMASIFIDDESMLPLVLEDGDITIKITQTQQIATGTPLNDKLFGFLRKYDQLQAQSMELIHRHDQAIMNGNDMVEVSNRLQDEYFSINEKLDTLVTNFIVDNFDNVLGPGVFMMVTNTGIPELSPWVEVIMSKATDYFKRDPYVRWYIETAKHVQNIQNGLEEVPMPMASPAHGTDAPPTPNQMACPQ